jgi:MSHA biogenesis protein MshJ
VAHLEALPTEPLVVPEDDAAPEKAGATERETAPSDVRFYRHGLRIELEGSFHETLAFLDEIEGLPGSFMWESVHYEVQEYPTAKVTLTVYMLGNREGWIGV